MNEFIFQKHFGLSIGSFDIRHQYFVNGSNESANTGWMVFPPRDATILLHSSLANSLKQNIYLVWVLFCLYASGQCLAGKIDFHPHSCFAEWIMPSSRISLYVAFVWQPLRPCWSQTPLCLVSIILTTQVPPKTFPHLWSCWLAVFRLADIFFGLHGVFLARIIITLWLDLPHTRVHVTPITEMLRWIILMEDNRNTHLGT